MENPPTIEPEQSFPSGKLSDRPFTKVRQILKLLTHKFPGVVIGILNRDMHFTHISEENLFSLDTESSNITTKTPWLNSAVRKEIKKVFQGKAIFCDVVAGKKFYQIKAFPYDDEESAIRNIICIVVDHTTEKLRERELLNAIEKEKELGELKSRFVSMASHEFRNPLTSILASTFLLGQLPETGWQKEKTVHLNRIKRSVNNLNNVLNEFLSLQKLEENKVPVVYSTVNIPEFIQDDLSEIEVLKKTGQHIQYQHTGKSNLAIIDHHILWSITTNLLSNSIKYSQAEGDIQITTQLSNDTFSLVIRDQGIGIPEDEQHHIFEKFFRARNALHIEGTGLGLHLVEKYVHLLEGTISFESQQDVGTTFTITLPVKIINNDNHETP